MNLGFCWNSIRLLLYYKFFRLLFIFFSLHLHQARYSFLWCFQEQLILGGDILETILYCSLNQQGLLLTFRRSPLEKHTFLNLTLHPLLIQNIITLTSSHKPSFFSKVFPSFLHCIFFYIIDWINIIDNILFINHFKLWSRTKPW